MDSLCSFTLSNSETNKHMKNHRSACADMRADDFKATELWSYDA
jgi:hypothetical protein